MSLHNRITWFAQGAIGDALMNLCLFSHILKEEKDAEIIFVSSRNNKLISELFSLYPQITVKESVSKIFLDLFKGGYYVFPPTFGNYSVRTRILARLLSFFPNHKVISFADKSGRGISKYIAPFDKEVSFYKNIESILDFIGIKRSIEFPRPHLPSEETLRLSTVYLKRKYIVVHPFAASPVRSLPLKRWVELMRYLEITYPEFEIIVTGGKEDIAAAEKIIANTKAHSLAGRLSIKELIDLLTHSHVFIGVDTGITHLASVLGCYSVVIGNLSNPTWLPTYNKSAIILFNKDHCTCQGDKSGNCFAYEDGQKYYRCMYEITDLQIYNSLDTQINRESSNPK